MKITSRAASITHVELMATLSGSTPAVAASVTSACAAAGRAKPASAPPRSAPLSRRVVIGPPRGWAFAGHPGPWAPKGLCPRVEDFAHAFLRLLLREAPGAPAVQRAKGGRRSLYTWTD